jgi:hypothetical protein
VRAIRYLVQHQYNGLHFGPEPGGHLCASHLVHRYLETVTHVARAVVLTASHRRVHGVGLIIGAVPSTAVTGRKGSRPS